MGVGGGRSGAGAWLAAVAAVAAAAAVAVVARRRARARRARRLALALACRVDSYFRRVHSPSPLEMSLANVLSFPCGAFELVAIDLRVAMPAEDGAAGGGGTVGLPLGTSAASEPGPLSADSDEAAGGAQTAQQGGCAPALSLVGSVRAEAAIVALRTQGGLVAAFEVRRELVNFKKACLCLFQDAQRLEMALQRQAMYFFRDNPSRSAYHLDERWQSYAEVANALENARAVRTALHDVRDMVKAVCTLPRHPDATQHVPARLRQLPASLLGTRAVERANAFVNLVVAGVPVFAKRTPNSHKRALPEGAAVPPPANSVWRNDLLHEGLNVALAVLRNGRRGGWAVTWGRVLEDFELEFVRLSLIARGAAKALAMWRVAVLLLEVISGLHADVRAARARLAALDCPFPTRDEVARPEAEQVLQAAVLKCKHTAALAGLDEAYNALCASLHDIVELHPLPRAGAPADEVGAHRCAPRLFVASDAPRGRRAMFLPSDTFARLGVLLASLGKQRDAYESAMRKAIAEEGWPPPPSAMRVRVNLPPQDPVPPARERVGLQPENERPGQHQTGRVGKRAGQQRQQHGRLPCRDCSTVVAVPWAIVCPGGRPRLLCWQCEEAARADGRCPLDDDAARAARASLSPAQSRSPRHAFCTHQQRCVVCDGSFHACPDCRLASGDGEVVSAICAEARPAAVFLDFDRTLCSTRTGGSPLIGSHSLDAELISVAAVHPTHVLTRNQHANEIRTFLSARGFRLAGLCVTAKKESKAKYVEEVLARASPHATAVFVDDSLAEVCDPRLAANEHVMRILFQRGVG